MPEWLGKQDRVKKFKIGDEMKQKMTWLYIANNAVIVLFFLFVCVMCRNTVVNQRQSQTYVRITEYTEQVVEAADAPLGIQEEYVIQLDELDEDDGSLIFYSHHQNVQVYIGNELVFSLQPSADNPFGKTPGSHYNAIPVYCKDAGKQIRIILSPVYENVKGVVPEFYYGSRFDIWVSMLAKNIFPFVLSLVAVVIGFIFIIFTIYNYRNSEVDKSLMMMGFFAVGIGMWKITDMDCMGLLFPYAQWLTYMPYLSLMIVVIPFAMFVKELFYLREHKLWYVLCFVSLLYNAAALLLHIMGIRDLRETLACNHAVMLALVLLVSYMLIHEWKSRGWNAKLRVMLICLSACLIGLTADIAMYYIFSGLSMMALGMCGFLVYIIVLGINSMRQMKALMNIGMEARHYEEMAYHDQLTGLYNRTAYAAFTTKADFTPEQCIVVMFDLNDLKKCNDTRGHEKGDRYIVQSAKLIWRAFGDAGKCYRMGGDEFCALLNNTSMDECRRRVEKLKKAAEDCNRRAPEEFPIRIACGYERYDSRMDYDLGDTLRRADKMMYHEKFMMKQAH